MIFQGSRRHGGVKTIFADVLGLKHCISWHSCAIFSRYKFTDVVFDAVSRQQPRVKDVLGRLQGRFVIGAIRPNALPPIYITSLHLNHVAEPTRLSGMTTSLLYLVNIFFGNIAIPESAKTLTSGTNIRHNVSTLRSIFSNHKKKLQNISHNPRWEPL